MQSSSPPSSTPTGPFAKVPPGWSTAVDERDGRIYYLEVATGRTSWIHPHALPVQGPKTEPPPLSRTHPQFWMNNNGGYFSENILDTPLNASRRPDNHQCYAFVALLVFPPIGIIAVVHSFLTDRAWKKGRYSDAMVHARQAPRFANFSICVGFAFWIWWLFLRREAKRVKWLPDWDFNFGN